MRFCSHEAFGQTNGKFKLVSFCDTVRKKKLREVCKSILLAADWVQDQKSARTSVFLVVRSKLDLLATQAGAPWSWRD